MALHQSCTALGTTRRLLSSAIRCATCTPIGRNGVRKSSGTPCQSNRPPTSQAENLMDIGTRSLFSEDHDIYRRTVRKFFEQEVKPFHRQWEKNGQVPRELWLKAGEQGVIGVGMPEEHGGAGGDFLHQAVALEEQMYANASGPGFGMHGHVVIPYFLRYGTADQIATIVPDLCKGRRIAALAITEPGAGSDMRAIKTNVKRDGDDWILNGSKIYISNGILCDLVIVVASTGTAESSKGISLFIVDDGMKGFKKGRKLEKLGLKAQDTAELFFEDVRLPSTALLGEVGKGLHHLMRDLPMERLLLGIATAAHMEWMFEEARAFVKDRKAFGSPIISLQTVQHKLAEMKTVICAARSFTDQGIELQMKGMLDNSVAAMVKYWTTDLLNKVAYDALQLHGGAGFMLEYPISRAYADARVQSIYAGTNEIMKEIIARPIKA